MSSVIVVELQDVATTTAVIPILAHSATTQFVMTRTRTAAKTVNSLQQAQSVALVSVTATPRRHVPETAPTVQRIKIRKMAQVVAMD